jgi:hypothetical protein
VGWTNFLIWLLRGKFDELPEIDSRCFSDFASGAARAVVRYYREGEAERLILEPLRELRQKSYCVGGGRELLLSACGHARSMVPRHLG